MNHDPGGKTRLRLQDGVRGMAEFSPGGHYRHWLSRSWDDLEVGLFTVYNGSKPISGITPYVLWIGMNPSTAEGDIDDPTIRKEMHFTRRLGFTSYIKCNVMDYRATYPIELSLLKEPSSPKNLDHISKFAKDAAIIMAAWGALPKSLSKYADDVLATIPYRIYAMGLTKDGSPRHPLYLRNDAQPIIYREAR
jgi:hypothetical protein